MADDGIAGDRLRHEDGVGPAPGLQQALDSAVLVAQHDLQEQHLLAVRLEPEMPGLDDAGVHRPDGHLVDFLTLELEERVALPIDRLLQRAHRCCGREDAGAPA